MSLQIRWDPLHKENETRLLDEGVYLSLTESSVWSYIFHFTSSTHLGTRRVRYGRGKWPGTGLPHGTKAKNKPPAALPVSFGVEVSLRLFSAWHQSCTFFPVISAFTTPLPTSRMSVPLMVTCGSGLPSLTHITTFGGIYVKDTTSAPSVKRISKIKRGTLHGFKPYRSKWTENPVEWRANKAKSHAGLVYETTTVASWLQVDLMDTTCNTYNGRRSQNSRICCRQHSEQCSCICTLILLSWCQW